MKLTLGHIALRVRDIDSMLKYYTYGLGLVEAFRINNDDGSLRIIFLHISFIVEDINTFKLEAESRGVIFDSEILKLRDNNLTLFLFDPEGNKLEIVETSKDSPHYMFENR